LSNLQGRRQILHRPSEEGIFDFVAAGSPHRMSSAERTQLRDKLLPVGLKYRVPPARGIVALLSIEKLQLLSSLDCRELQYRLLENEKATA